MSTRGAVQAALAGRLGSETEARWMVEEVVGRPGRSAAPVSDGAAAALSRMADRRLAGEPLQYVLGSWAFRAIEVAVDARALIPRPETEQVAEVAIAELRRTVAGRPPAGGAVVVDLGTGTGAIALSLAVELGAPLDRSIERLAVWATDDDPAALALADANRTRVGTAWPGAAERVRLRAGQWFDALPLDLVGRVDVVVSNPPYVSEEEWAVLDPEVRREPRRALVAGPGSDGTPGLAALEAVAAGASEWLAPGGAVVLELAPHQAGPAAGLAERLGYRDVRVLPDLAGRARVLVGRR